MYYTFYYTLPSLKIKTIEDYKKRINEIIFWQIKETFLLRIDFFHLYFDFSSCNTLGDIIWSILGALFMSAIYLISIPFAIAYLALCVAELIIDTLLLPLFLTPIIRIIPIIVVSVMWAFSLGIGIFGMCAIKKQ